MSVDVNEPEPVNDVPEWKGMSMDEIRKGLGVYDCQELPPICPSSTHTVLVSVRFRLNYSFQYVHVDFYWKILLISYHCLQEEHQNHILCIRWTNGVKIM